MSYKVRFIEPDVHYKNIKSEIDSTMQDVLSRGDLVYRSDLKNFEQNLADFVGTKFAVGLNSGFHALHLSLIALNIGSGDEVIVPAHTFVASISAIALVGATPVLVDVAEDYNMNVNTIENFITDKTKAIMPVYLNGRICDMDAIMQIAQKHNLMIIEDAAQALGTTFKNKKAGSFGNTGCFSFYPFKILGAFGDAGAITTNDEEVATKISRLRYNGEDRETGEYHCHGYTCLLDNLQAAVLDVKLKHLPNWLNRRIAIAQIYKEGLSNIGDLRLPHFEKEGFHDIFQNYVIRTKKREELFNYLTENGVETLIHWRKPVWEHKALNLGNPNLPETTAICDEVISLPMNAEISDESVAQTIETVKKFFE